jgi:hypothetical protein
MIRFLTSLVTIVTLIAIDNQASGADGLTNYGDLMRLVVWALIALNAGQMYGQVVEYARDEENAHERV